MGKDYQQGFNCGKQILGEKPKTGIVDTHKNKSNWRQQKQNLNWFLAALQYNNYFIQGNIFLL